MAYKYLIFVVCALAITSNNALETLNGRIKITTGTTSGCSDTVNFIGTQLIPVYQEFRDYLEIEFVPWGRTVRNEDGTLTCQFGVNDCWANRLHRCVLDILKDNQDAQIHYMNCEFTTPYPSFLQGSYLCVQAVGLNLVEVDYCMSTTGDILETAAQEAAAAPMQIINFVPPIVFNDQIDVNLHTQARTNLRNMVCNALIQDPSVPITSC